MIWVEAKTVEWEVLQMIITLWSNEGIVELMFGWYHLRIVFILRVYMQFVWQYLWLGWQAKVCPLVNDTLSQISVSPYCNNRFDVLSNSTWLFDNQLGGTSVHLLIWPRYECSCKLHFLSVHKRWMTMQPVMCQANWEPKCSELRVICHCGMISFIISWCILCEGDLIMLSMYVQTMKWKYERKGERVTHSFNCVE